MTGRYCALIPAFNAAETIGEVVRGAKQRGVDVVVIDDGSTDATASRAAAEGALVISLLDNQGKGTALRTGFRYALRTRYDGVVTMDSDGQHHPDDIAQLVQAGERQHAALVLGDRMANGAAMPQVRLWTNRLMSAVISRLIRQAIPDSQCGFRFIRAEVLADLTALRAARYEIETEVLLAAAAKRWKIISVPVQTIYAGQPSHIRPVRETVRFLCILFRYLLHRR